MSVNELHRNKNETIKSYICPLCNSHLEFKFLNITNKIIVCSNKAVR